MKTTTVTYDVRRAADDLHLGPGLSSNRAAPTSPRFLLLRGDEDEEEKEEGWGRDAEAEEGEGVCLTNRSLHSPRASSNGLLLGIRASMDGVMSSTALEPLKTLFAWDDKVSLRSSETSWLDGLRGLAALQVFLYHLWGRHLSYNHSFGSTPDDYQLYQLPIFRPIWGGGAGAIHVFFVISGYALSVKCLTLMRRGQTEALFNSLCSSVFRRPFRLFLPIALIAFPTMLMIRLVNMDNGFLLQGEFKKTLWLQMVDFVDVFDSFINPFADHDERANRMAFVPPAWTIPLEFYGSLVVFIVIPLISRFRAFKVRAIITGLLAFYAIHRGQWWTSNFIVGVLLADWVLERKSQGAGAQLSEKATFDSDKGWVCRFGGLRTILFALVCFYGYYLGGMPPASAKFDFHPAPKPGYEYLYKLFPPWWMFRLDGNERWYWFWCGNLTTLGASQVPLIRRGLESRFCQWLGKISFALYLCHAHVITLGEHSIDGMARLVSSNAVWMCLVEILTMGPVIFVLSGLVERYIDRPSVRWARALEEYCMSVGADGDERPTLV